MYPGRPPEVPEALEHLFRHESGRMVSALTRILGTRHLDLAEECVQEALCRALEVWKYHGVPERPSGWLMTTALRCALDVLRRRRAYSRIAPELAGILQSRLAADQSFEDEQVRLMIACCDLGLPPESRIAAVLKFLCGFGIEEIARAFLTTAAAIQKRIERAKRILRRSRWFSQPPGGAELLERVASVQQALYLLFNEGYHGGQPVRQELCAEAMRLGILLREHVAESLARTNALLALMCFHASRLPARVDDDGCLVLLEAQDRAKWDRELIGQGFRFLSQSGEGADISEYHIEAGIAALHCGARSVQDTDWGAIVRLYDCLLQLRPSPVVALNRAIALGQRDGAERGLRELLSLRGRRRLKDYPFYPLALAEFYRRGNQRGKALQELERAKSVARSPAERRLIEERIQDCIPG